MILTASGKMLASASRPEPARGTDNSLLNRMRSNSANYVIVKLAESTFGRYKRHREPVRGVVDVLVNVASMPAAVGGYRPRDRISEDDRCGAGLFLRQMSVYLGQDQSRRSSLSFVELGHVGVSTPFPREPGLTSALAGSR